MSKLEAWDDLVDTSPKKDHFKIQQKPDGNWRLTHFGIDMGVYDTQEAAEAGMMRIIRPLAFTYDERGVLIK